MVLHPQLIQLLIVEAAEFPRQAAERANECELGCDDVNGETEAGFPRKREAILGFALHLLERISRGEKITDQPATAIRRKRKVTNLVRGIEAALYQIATGLDVSRPWQDDISENRIGTRQEALQSALFDQ